MATASGGSGTLARPGEGAPESQEKQELLWEMVEKAWEMVEKAGAGLEESGKVFCTSCCWPIPTFSPVLEQTLARLV